MKLPSNDKNTRQEQGSLPIRANIRQFTKAPIRYVNDTPQQIINYMSGNQQLNGAVRAMTYTVSIFMRLLPYLMNNCKPHPMILRCYFCKIYRYLIAIGNTINFTVYMKDKLLKLQSNNLPHRKGVPSHKLPTVSQGQATKHPFNKHQTFDIMK